MGNLLRHGIDMYRQTINIKKTKKTVLQGTLSDESDSDVILIRTGTSKEPVKAKFKGKTPKKKDSKYRRVAKFLILIGSEQASGILAELDPDQVDEITKEITTIKTIQPEEREEILSEFKKLFSDRITQPYRLRGFAKGGIDTARQILYAAKGPEKGEALLNRAIPQSKENPFSFLEEYSPEQLVMLFKDESDQTVAMILARLSSQLSAGTINKLPPSRKPGVLRRVAYQGEVLPEVLEKVSAAFKEKVRHVSGGAKDVEVDGMQTLAAILKHGDYSFSDRLIDELEMEDPRIGRKLKEKLYTLDDVINAVERPLQDKLKKMTEREIAMLLKGRKKEFFDKILSCVSAGRSKLILEEFEILGPVPKRESDAAANDFLAWLRVARERGDIMFYNDKDLVYL